MRAGSERICRVRGVSGRPRCRLREQARLQQDRVWLGAHDLLERGLPAKLTTRSVRRTEVSASRASSAPTRPRMAWGAGLVGARPAREAYDSECQADRGVSFASRLDSNKTAYGSGCTTRWSEACPRSLRLGVSGGPRCQLREQARLQQDRVWLGAQDLLERGSPARLTTRSVRQTEVSASRAGSTPTRPRMAPGARLVGARPAREANDAECQVDRGVGFASKLGSNKTAYGLGRTTCWSEARPRG